MKAESKKLGNDRGCLDRGQRRGPAAADAAAAAAATLLILVGTPHVPRVRFHRAGDGAQRNEKEKKNKQTKQKNKTKKKRNPSVIVGHRSTTRADSNSLPGIIYIIIYCIPPPPKKKIYPDTSNDVWFGVVSKFEKKKKR